MSELESIRTFLRVAERGSFSDVAREIGIGQPAVSKQIAALEALLGAQLIRRTSAKLTLTLAGQDFYESMTHIVEDLDAARSRVGLGQTAPSGLVRVTASPAFGRLHIVPRLPEFFDRYPEISVDLRSSERAPNLVEDGLDLAVHTGDLEDSTLRARKIASTALVTVAAPAYLDRHGEPANPAELDHHRRIAYAPFGSPRDWRFMVDGRLVTHQPHGTLRTDDAEQIRAAVLAAIGIAFAPAWLFAGEIDSGAVRLLLRDAAPPPLPISAVHQAGRMLPTRVQIFIEFLAAIFASSPYLMITR